MTRQGMMIDESFPFLKPSQWGPAPAVPRLQNCHLPRLTHLIFLSSIMNETVRWMCAALEKLNLIKLN
jgi:hypothetical protein